MNEITNIHLGRQAFTISIEAHHALKQYLADIQKQVKDKDVVNEVELRMAEILNEQGITGEKVILNEDVTYLKEQLGEPTEFSDDDDATEPQPTHDSNPKRLFRDTNNGMVAGVAAGIANYFGIDVVIVRLLFVIAILGGGTGLLIYLALWLVIPPAVTPSEKLQMQGKPVTIDALKETIEKADIQGAARRANGVILPIINSLFRIFIKITGIGFIIGGIATIFSVGAVKTYMLLHNGQLFQENLFPVGSREQLLVNIGVILAVIVALFLIFIGVATYKRKWPLRSWVTATLIGIFIVGSAAGMALSADIEPKLHERYLASSYVTPISGIEPFDKITSTGGLDVEYVSSPAYAVSLHYFGKPDISKIKITVADKVLHIDATAFDGNAHCTMLCLYPYYNMVVQVSAPNIQDFNLPRGDELFLPGDPRYK